MKGQYSGEVVSEGAVWGWGVGRGGGVVSEGAVLGEVVSEGAVLGGGGEWGQYWGGGGCLHFLQDHVPGPRCHFEIVIIYYGLTK